MPTIPFNWGSLTSPPVAATLSPGGNRGTVMPISIQTLDQLGKVIDTVMLSLLSNSYLFYPQNGPENPNSF